MLNFSIFGIPVRIQPFFWLICLFLSGAMGEEAGPRMLITVGVAVVVFATSILAHELGHALTGIKLGGGTTWIELTGFGGYAAFQGTRLDRKQRRLMSFAGPAAGLSLALLATLVLVILTGPEAGLYLAKWFTLPSPQIWGPPPLEAKLFYGDLSFGARTLLELWFFANVWWSVLNLLPILPLDGGHILETYLKSPKQVHQVGMITAVVIGLLGLSFTASLLLPIVMGFFAYQNWKAMQEARY